MVLNSGYRPDRAKKLSCRELIAYLISLNLLTGLPMASKVYNFFLSGGGYFREVVVGVYRPPHLIFTLFQSNIYKVNVREFLHRDLCRENIKYLPMLSEGSH